MTSAKPKLDRFATFFALIPTPDGAEQELEWFQRAILLLYFAGIKHVLVLIPKGNGKTSLLAALAVFHMLTHPNPAVFIGASTVEQADTIYHECIRIVRLRAAWRKKLKPSPGYRAIYAQGVSGKAEPDRGKLKILASDKLGKGSLEGLQPTLGIVEELHAHVNDALYAAIHGGLPKRNGQMLSISTAGADEESLLGRIRDKAHKMAHKVRRAALTITRSDGNEFAMLEWSIGEKADPEALDVVKGANPASFVTRQALADTLADPGISTTRWKRYHCGLWAVPEGKWLDPELFDACAHPRAAIPDGERIVLGYDHARRFDHAALIALLPDEPEIGEDGMPVEGSGSGLLVPVHLWVPSEEDGGKVAYWKIKQAIREACERWSVAGVGFDKLGGFAQSAEELEDEGLPMIEVSMKSPVWGPLTAELEAAIKSKRLRHNGNADLRKHFIAGETKDSEHGERLHGRVEGKVDALMASGIAWYTAFNTDALFGGGSVYEDRGVVVL